MASQTPQQMLSCSDEDFDNTLGNMEIKDMIATVSLLQNEMEGEQTKFNDLSTRLSKCEEGSNDYAALSEQLMTSQSRLATLMDRNMKCFAQQTSGSEDPAKKNVSVIQVGGKQKEPDKERRTSKEGTFTLRSSAAKVDPQSVNVTNIVVTGNNHVDNHVKSPEIKIAKPVKQETVTMATTEKPQTNGTHKVNGEASEEKIDFSAARSMFESKPTQPKKKSVQQTYTVTKPAVHATQSQQPSSKAKSGSWQSQLSRLASNDFSVSMASQNTAVSTAQLKPQSVKKSLSVDQSLASQRSSSPVQIRQLSVQEMRSKQTISAKEVNKNSIQSPSESSQTNGNHTVITQEKTTVANEVSPAANAEKHSPASVVKQPVVAKAPTVAKQPSPPMVAVHSDIVSQTSTLKSQASESSSGEVVRASKRVAALYMSEKMQEAKEEPDEKVQERVTLMQWDPTKLLNDLYQVHLPEENSTEANYIDMEGYMEKLPLNKRKATLLKTWKKRYFRASQGCLHYFESRSQVDTSVDSPDDSSENGDVDRPSGSIHLMGGTVEELGGCMLAIDDGRGRYMVVRCPTETMCQHWHQALMTHCVDNQQSRWVRPVLNPTSHSTKKVVIIDLGSSSIRAGILGDQPSLPSVFFPTVVASQSNRVVVGSEAYKPSVRQSAALSYPIKPSQLVDKFTINMGVIPDILMHVFNLLKADPSEHYVMLSAPTNLSDKFKAQFMDILVKKFKVLGANIQNQALLALYSYNMTSGIVVDLGERLEILPITEGYIVEAGASQQIYGGQAVSQALNTSFTERRYRFFTEVESLLVRLALEKMCYFSSDYKHELKSTMESKSDKKVLSLKDYDLPPDTYTELINDVGWFKAPEGLFDLSLWGLDNTPLHKLVQQAVQACPMDTRREMWRSIFLSGGLSTMPGLPERLQLELAKIVPSSITVQVHCSPHRGHAAFIGACALANMTAFQHSCITAEEWLKSGAKSLRKWHTF